MEPDDAGMRLLVEDDGQVARARHLHRGGAAMRVVMAEDSAVVRDGMARLLQDDGYVVAATVGNADDPLDAAERHNPDLVIADVRMPPTMTDDGALAAEELRRRHPAAG